MNPKIIKRIGWAATIIGGLTSILASWASEKTQEAMIEEKITARFNEQFGLNEPVKSVAELNGETAGE